MEEAKLTKSELVMVEAALRTIKAFNSLNISSTGRVLIYAFCAADGHWSAKSLSEVTGIPRTNILRRLEKWKKQGLAVREEAGWLLSPEYKPIFYLIVRETREIMMGERASYSQKLLDVAGKSEADWFSFSPFPNTE